MGAATREPIGMKRAKTWNQDVENASAALRGIRNDVPKDGASADSSASGDWPKRAARPRPRPRRYRFQCAGWRSREEYLDSQYSDEISWWSDLGLVEKLQTKNGLFMYFRPSGDLARWS